MKESENCALRVSSSFVNTAYVFSMMRRIVACIKNQLELSVSTQPPYAIHIHIVSVEFPTVRIIQPTCVNEAFSFWASYAIDWIGPQRRHPLGAVKVMARMSPLMPPKLIVCYLVLEAWFSPSQQDHSHPKSVDVNQESIQLEEIFYDDERLASFRSKIVRNGLRSFSTVLLKFPYSSWSVIRIWIWRLKCVRRCSRLCSDYQECLACIPSAYRYRTSAK